MRFVAWALVILGCSSPAPVKSDESLGTSRAGDTQRSSWTHQRIANELASNPRRILTELAREPFVFADVDAGTREMVCGESAQKVIEQSAPTFAMMAIDTCTAQKDGPSTYVCIRGDAQGPIAIATFELQGEWRLTYLMVATRLDAAKIKAAGISAREYAASRVPCP